jgi:glycosyltransferase involved in cell wall biosynthesis
VFDLSDGPPVESANGEIGWLVGAYKDAVTQLGGQAVLFPSMLGDCYGACAALTRDIAIDVRVIGWAHSQNGYDVRVVSHYEPALCRAAAVSGRLVDDIRACWPGREADVDLVPTGVEFGEVRGTERASGVKGRTIVYTGRMDEGIKRVSALVHMSDALVAQGEKHELVLVGDGPAGHEIDRMISVRNGGPMRQIRRIPNAGPAEIRNVLGESEFFVLPSRLEGLSVSMLEAMSEGCCCVVTAENSGASEAIEHGVSGILLETDSGASAERAGADVAGAILATSRSIAAQLGVRAREVVRERFSLAGHLRAVSALVDAAAGGQVRRWPKEKDAAFTARPGVVGSGTVPGDADIRLRLVMDTLRGRSVAVHGTGRHSEELAHVLREYVNEIRVFLDDDPARQGREFLGRPVVAPENAAAMGATDVVISSHLHQGEIWSRRNEHERRGVRVHRIYA